MGEFVALFEVGFRGDGFVVTLLENRFGLFGGILNQAGVGLRAGTRHEVADFAALFVRAGHQGENTGDVSTLSIAAGEEVQHFGRPAHPVEIALKFAVRFFEFFFLTVHRPTVGSGKQPFQQRRAHRFHHVPAGGRERNRLRGTVAVEFRRLVGQADLDEIRLGDGRVHLLPLRPRLRSQIDPDHRGEQQVDDQECDAECPHGDGSSRRFVAWPEYGHATAGRPMGSLFTDSDGWGRN